MQYATLTVVRNEQETVNQAISAIVNQSAPPSHIVVIDDGSTDQTPGKLKSLEEQYPGLNVRTRKNRGYSALGTYLMSDVYNTGLAVLDQFSDWDYLIVVPGDLALDRDYAMKLLGRMGDKIGITGGINRDKKFLSDYNRDHVIGAGRVIKREILNHLGNRLPRNYDWESAVLHCATFLGYEIRRHDDCFFDMRRGGTGHDINYTGWGRGMKNANYHPLVVMGRVMKELLIRRDYNRAIRLLVGYLAEPGASSYPDYSVYLREKQKLRIVTRK